LDQVQVLRGCIPVNRPTALSIPRSIEAQRKAGRPLAVILATGRKDHMIRARKSIVVGLASLALVFGGNAASKANSSFQTQAFGPASTDFSGEFELNQFNPTLGTLLSVKIDFGLTFSTTITVTNNSTSTASSGTVRTEVQAGLTDTGTFSTVLSTL